MRNQKGGLRAAFFIVIASGSEATQLVIIIEVQRIDCTFFGNSIWIASLPLATT